MRSFPVRRLAWDHRGREHAAYTDYERIHTHDEFFCQRCLRPRLVLTAVGERVIPAPATKKAARLAAALVT
jgi:hypothetical protein